ncbi:hypothetical protein V1512DRAFT_258013 [Lipomyces arxii]|uniref:uncharacterized protein n=1 Tax=Lipomyces arxii TaxID=56418 RepID=UPI0034CF96D0
MAKKTANRSNSRAARRAMPSPPPELNLRDTAISKELNTPEIAHSLKKRQLKRQNVPQLSKKQRNKIDKGQSRSDMLKQKINNRTARWQSNSAQRKNKDYELKSSSGIVTNTENGILEKTDKSNLNGIGLLKYARNMNVGGMEIDNGSDSGSEDINLLEANARETPNWHYTGSTYSDNGLLVTVAGKGSFDDLDLLDLPS